MHQLSNQTRQQLYEHFDLTRLLDAIRQLDQIQCILKKGQNGQAPEIWDELLKLHEMVGRAMSENDVSVNWDELWDITSKMKYFFDDLVGVADEIRTTMQDLLSFRS